MDTFALWGLGGLAIVLAGRAAYARFLLSRAKHPSLQGHARWARRIARRIPFYEYDERRFFDSDGAPPAVAALRKAGFERLAAVFDARAPLTVAAGERLETSVSDLQFTKRYRVPFQYSRYVARRLKVGSMLQSSSGVSVTDLDGRTDYDLTGSYGVNLFGYDFYKACIDAGVEHVKDLGPVLGAYHPIVEDNLRRLKAISGLDEVSFHMSGTEAVMQAVRLARYHTGRTHVVRFCGAYHGWWDDVQPGMGNPVTVRHTYTLKEMDDATLRVLDSRRDIACVLVNPVQSLHPNAGAPGDGALVGSQQPSGLDRDVYRAWLKALRAVCTRRSIVLIFDEVFVGFRLAYGGAQEYFGISADVVTYGKTLGGGLPIGVVCGRARYMKRFRDDRPSDFCFARGTFNTHPYVMGAMHEFLRRLDEPARRASYVGMDETWNARSQALNRRLADEGLPVRVANLVSIWTVCYTASSRYNWMFQYYLRADGLALSWIGTGRLFFSHNYTDADVAAVSDRFVAAARAMRNDGWWWRSEACTDRAIKVQIAREILAALRSRPAPAPRHAGSSDTIGSKSWPRTT
jgi:glutamate-1-semialdehyde 2,1-aminomutase